MALRSPTLQAVWPASQSMSLVEGSIEDAARALEAEARRILRRVPLSTRWRPFVGAGQAIGEVETYAMLPTEYLVLPTRTRWSILWCNDALCSGYVSLAYNLTRLHGLTTLSFTANDKDAGTQFFYWRKTPNGELVERSVQACREGRRWRYFASGPPLPEEDEAGYRAWRKRDRLDEARLEALMSRLGAWPWDEAHYDHRSDARYFQLTRDEVPPTVEFRSRREILGREA